MSIQNIKENIPLSIGEYLVKDLEISDSHNTDYELYINGTLIFGRYDNVEIYVRDKFIIFEFSKDEYSFKCKRVVINFDSINKYELKEW